MKTINSKKRHSLFGKVLLLTAVAAGFGSCQKYDLDKRMPEWLGPSVYDYLVENGFKTYVNLIEDLDYKEVLSKTGSKTLFVADEEAVQRFYQSGKFKKGDGTPVTRYEDLSLAQKKMILFGSMLNNVYQVAMLSSTQATADGEKPQRGDAMRRVSSSSVFDTLTVIPASEMPGYNKFWSSIKASGRKIVCLQDNTVKPMVFFTPKFLEAKKITDDDYNFLFNIGQYSRTGVGGRLPNDASVNGIRIKTQNVKCLNGFIHVMEDVVYSLPNMAEYLLNNPQATMYTAIVERYSLPYAAPGSNELAKEVQRLIDAGEVEVAADAWRDTIYTKRYFSIRNQSTPNASKAEDGLYKYREIPSDGVLKFDPGWNSYYSTTSSTTAANVALQQNMGVMLVPHNEALTQWFNDGEGAPLKDLYHTLDSVPDGIIERLVYNNMLNSLVGSVPSKFSSVLNDANDPLDIKPEHVDSVVMCCNGAIYFTNVVFSPTAYRSVSFPALVNKDSYLSIMNKAKEALDFDAYLNSMVSTYSFFIPTDQALQNYLDPVSYHKNQGVRMAFNYDKRTSSIKAQTYKYDFDTLSNNTGSPEELGSVEDYSDGLNGRILDRLEDILDYHVIIGNVEDTVYNYFQTKGRGTIYFKVINDDPTNFEAYVGGGYQLERNLAEATPADPYAGLIHIQDRTADKQTDPSYRQKRYDMTRTGNGHSYVIDEPLMTSRKNVYDILSDSVNYPEFSEFFKLIPGSLLEDLRDKQYSTGQDNNLTTLNTYHYTVYVPTNQSIKEGIAQHKIITPAFIDSVETHYENVVADINDAIDLGNEELAASLEMAYKMEIIGKLEKNQEFDKDTAAINAARKAYLDLIGTGVDPESQEAKEAEAVITKAISDSTKFMGNMTYTAYVSKLSAERENFVKYHIQDNSVYYGAEFKLDTVGARATSAEYETAYMNSYNQFEKLSVVSNNDGIFVTDGQSLATAQRNKRKVVIANSESGRPLYNIMCREYLLNGNTRETSTLIETSSYVVIHQIDGPLYFK